jgi:hypothetical protein
MKMRIAFSIGILLITILLAEGCVQHPAGSNIPSVSNSPVQFPKTSSPPTSVPSNSLPTITSSQQSTIYFGDNGFTNYGYWSTNITVSPGFWQPGLPLIIESTLRISEDHLQRLAKAGLKVDGLCMLVTAERTFDPSGWLRLPSDERMSTLLAPTGLAIEGGVQGAVTNRFGATDFRTPVDEFQAVLLPVPDNNGLYQYTFKINTRLPDNLPPGIYRIRMDYGITIKKRYLSLNGDTFAYRPFANTVYPYIAIQSYLYSPPIRASGVYVTGQQIDAAKIQPRIPWIILGNYNSNGYSGVVADEDKGRFALSPRTLIPDDVILPLYAPDNKTRLSYSLEPQFPADTIDTYSNISWNYTRGAVSINVTGPDGKTTSLGTASFVGKTGQWPTTRNPAFTAWKPSSYGYYTVNETGWIEDTWGNRYEGGGTYHFWIANRMTLATATFQGQAYPVGSKYGKDVAFDPAVPAYVQVTATLYPNSDQSKVKSISYSGNASIGGVYGAAQGMQPFTLDTPGEYCAHVLARYTDQEGNLWVSVMTHAGVVYPTDSSIVARGKKLTAKGKLVDEGDTNLEGYIDTQDVAHLQHINYPFKSGDVLLIASDHKGADKIEPVLTYENASDPAPYDPNLQTIGATNLKIKTSNGYSPHLFPEYITDWAYYYAGAPRPGFMSRFIVGESMVRAPYWPVSPNSFGGQINASSNGDLPGTIYRLIGGVVVRKQNAAPAYAGYLSNGFILPPGTNNNRVIAPGSEELLGADGTKSRVFLVSTRPGMIYETGAPFTPVAQIDPILPVTVTYTLMYPDGRKVVSQGQGDQFGSWAGTKCILDIPGKYHYNIVADWQGYKGYMPGLPKDGSDFYVIDKNKPDGAGSLKLNLPELSSFTPPGPLTITGTSTSTSISYAALTPGAVLDGGTIPVNNGKFTYTFDPVAMNQKVPHYDVVNITNGKWELKEVVQITFFSTEKGPGGATYDTAIRVILRGNTVLYVY